MERQRLDSAVEIPRLKITPDAGSKVSATPTYSADPPPQGPATQQHTQSRLLSLPAELQLAIWEFAVIREDALLVNCPCDSAFGGWTDEYYEEVHLWENGTEHSPWQPAITRVCRSIRVDALPMWFKHNSFQSGYCWETNLAMTLDWLKIIGAENRKKMKHFYFYDANSQHDHYCSKDLTKLKRSAVFREFGGVMKSTYDGECCRHDVAFCDENVDDELDGLEGLFNDASIT
ncbi:hypothetical protein DOTSEDRAFT_134645 [Dothistroma septosporum NZE10]|uniref:Uncharacterized protein n=1 Tax=Dothistroma septosporum (strain NZE10 / CBS 128990) TaxID=675120 RepID=N1PKB1_DOTSN|nr:hypothetical protein DOTSEDRAFT_134645 [Dothistroma septosporum NZE10]